MVRLTAPPGLADAFIAPLLARFHQRFPRIAAVWDFLAEHLSNVERAGELVTPA